MESKIRLGISTCLLGEQVRYDGGHKWDRFLTDTLGKYVEFIPVCPEYELGLGVPREPMHLVGDPTKPRLITVHTKIDHTDAMIDWSRRRVESLARENLCGFVFKSKSPSSGMERVKVYDEKGMPRKSGTGIFAREFMSRFPRLPVEEEGRLHDPSLRENFIERIFVCRRWRGFVEHDGSPSGLLDFHTRHKLLLMSHGTRQLSLLGNLVATQHERPFDETVARYEAGLQETLRLLATVKKNVNVLQHIMGYFKKQLSADEKQELIEIIGLYQNDNVPLIVPVTLLNHYVRKYREPYLMSQWYLNPHPVELKLRNHA